MIGSIYIKPDKTRLIAPETTLKKVPLKGLFIGAYWISMWILAACGFILLVLTALSDMPIQYKAMAVIFFSMIPGFFVAHILMNQPDKNDRLYL